MKPMQISARKLAAEIDVSPSRVSELVPGQRPITADTARSGRRDSSWNRLMRVAHIALLAEIRSRSGLRQPALRWPAG